MAGGAAWRMRSSSRACNHRPSPGIASLLDVTDQVGSRRVLHALQEVGKGERHGCLQWGVGMVGRLGTLHEARRRRRQVAAVGQQALPSSLPNIAGRVSDGDGPPGAAEPPGQMRAAVLVPRGSVASAHRR